MSTEYVLASINPPSIFNFYPSPHQARCDRARANSYGPTWPTYEPMTYETFLVAERAHWLSQPEEEITRERFIEMLEILPPMQWEQTATYSRFLLSEMTSGPYTQQYIQRKTATGSTYAVKIVDALDRSTWLS